MTSVEAVATTTPQESATALPATLEPETAEAEPSATEVPVAPTATSAPAPSATAAPAAASTPGVEETVAPVAPAGGSIVALGDFEVVNLITGSTQNIAELSPSGPTMLWFWAPH